MGGAREADGLDGLDGGGGGHPLAGIYVVSCLICGRVRYARRPERCACGAGAHAQAGRPLAELREGPNRRPEDTHAARWSRPSARRRAE